MDKTIVNNCSGGMIWIAGWLFTLGYLGLPFFWKGVFALVLWPYYLGQYVVL